MYRFSSMRLFALSTCQHLSNPRHFRYVCFLTLAGHLPRTTSFPSLYRPSTASRLRLFFPTPRLASAALAPLAPKGARGPVGEALLPRARPRWRDRSVTPTEQSPLTPDPSRPQGRGEKKAAGGCPGRSAPPPGRRG